MFDLMILHPLRSSDIFDLVARSFKFSGSLIFRVSEFFKLRMLDVFLFLILQMFIFSLFLNFVFWSFNLLIPNSHSSKLRSPMVPSITMVLRCAVCSLRYGVIGYSRAHPNFCTSATFAVRRGWCRLIGNGKTCITQELKMIRTSEFEGKNTRSSEQFLVVKFRENQFRSFKEQTYVQTYTVAEGRSVLYSK